MNADDDLADAIALLREAVPELLGESWSELRVCGVCYHYDGHRPDCLVKRIVDFCGDKDD